MKLKVLVNRGGSLHERGKIILVAPELEQDGWTPGVHVYTSNGEHIAGDVMRFDLAAGEFYDYVEGTNIELGAALDALGGREAAERALHKVMAE